jgi:hypothetical protein
MVETEKIPKGKKRCTGECGRILPATPEFFHRQGVTKKGRQCIHAICRACKNVHGLPEKLPKGKKKCTKCERILPDTPKHFHRRMLTKEGRQLLVGTCKACKNVHGLPEKLPQGKKRCTKCERILPATPEFFHRNGVTKKGLKCLVSSCKACKNVHGLPDKLPQGKKMCEADLELVRKMEEATRQRKRPLWRRWWDRRFRRRQTP